MPHNADDMRQGASAPRPAPREREDAMFAQDPGAPDIVGAQPIPTSAYLQTELSWLRTRLSIQRTYLSWTRFAISLTGFGFTLFQLLPRLAVRDLPPDAPRNYALAFIGAGVVVEIAAVIMRNAETRFGRAFEADSIGEKEGMPNWRLGNLLAAFVIVTALFAMAWIAQQ
ncbi:MAG: YidH family protein [Thermomicrobiales bacterium]